MVELIREELNVAAKVLDDFLADDTNLNAIEQAANLMVESIRNEGKLISCGNGGSNCDASHFAEELAGKFREDRDPIPAISISDSSFITCVGNDYGFDRIFTRFVRGFGKKGDVLLAISTSGDSRNVVTAAEIAKQKGMKVVALTGNKGGALQEFADVEIRVPYNGYADRIQEIHIKVIHILIFLIEKKFFGN